jgi:hypothetical protein
MLSHFVYFDSTSVNTAWFKLAMLLKSVAAALKVLLHAPSLLRKRLFPAPDVRHEEAVSI